MIKSYTVIPKISPYNLSIKLSNSVHIIRHYSSFSNCQNLGFLLLII